MCDGLGLGCDGVVVVVRVEQQRRAGPPKHVLNGPRVPSKQVGGRRDVLDLC